MYPPGMLLKLKRKVEEIWRRMWDSVRKENNFLVVLYLGKMAPITSLLTGVGLRVIHCAGDEDERRRHEQPAANKKQKQHHMQNFLQWVLSCIY
ncbi:hypothetical protein E2C01_066136 [Portunus trituberculatus]|uniref:Uncharacterized protein n=1 Tax=Portunus trituberculatus TaxID=210409 RepID=A0A5B7HPG7_PORTR|nr:hypothetical protein [Portunus trituberculatus]